MNRRPGGAQFIPRPAAWTHGDAPPWAGTERPISVDEVLARLPTEPARPATPTSPTARRSAVLVLLRDGDEGAEVLLTKRSSSLRNHRGEIAFPGGRAEPDETALQTALREAYEEVGLDPSVVIPHGELSHLETVVSDSYVIPVVGSTTVDPMVSPGGTGEVDRVLWVPLVELAAPNTFRAEFWGPTHRFPIYFFELDDETVWGATGRMLYELLTLVYAPAD